MHHAFNDLHDEHIKVVKQHICTKKELDNRCKLFDKMEKDFFLLQNMYELAEKKAKERLADCIRLEQKIRSLESDLAKFTSSRKILNTLLGNQPTTSERFGIGYNSNANKKLGTKFVRPVSNTHDVSKSTHNAYTSSTCHFCNRKGHVTSTCHFKRLANKGYKQIWKRKTPLNETDLQGPIEKLGT